MAPSTEAALVKAIREKMQARGGFVHKTHGDPRTRKGVPDLEGCYRGYYLGIEVKLPGKEGNLTELQAATLRNIKKAGGIARMVTTWAEVEAILIAIDRARDG